MMHTREKLTLAWATRGLEAIKAMISVAPKALSSLSSIRIICDLADEDVDPLDDTEKHESGC